MNLIRVRRSKSLIRDMKTTKTVGKSTESVIVAVDRESWTHDAESMNDDKNIYPSSSVVRNTINIAFILWKVFFISV